MNQKVRVSLSAAISRCFGVVFMMLSDVFEAESCARLYCLNLAPCNSACNTACHTHHDTRATTSYKVQIEEYLEAAADAETKLASMLSATVRKSLWLGQQGQQQQHQQQQQLRQQLEAVTSSCIPASFLHPPSSQASNPTQPNPTHHNRQEYEALVGKVVRVMVYKQHEKPGVPVKRQELLDATTVRVLCVCCGCAVRVLYVCCGCAVAVLGAVLGVVGPGANSRLLVGWVRLCWAVCV